MSASPGTPSTQTMPWNGNDCVWTNPAWVINHAVYATQIHEAPFTLWAVTIRTIVQELVIVLVTWLWVRGLSTFCSAGLSGRSPRPRGGPPYAWIRYRWGQPLLDNSLRQMHPVLRGLIKSRLLIPNLWARYLANSSSVLYIRACEGFMWGAPDYSYAYSQALQCKGWSGMECITVG